MIIRTKNIDILSFRGPLPVTINGVTINSDQYSVNGQFPITLQPNQKTTLTVSLDKGPAGKSHYCYHK